MFSGETYQKETEVGKVSLLIGLMKEVFKIQVDANATCHAVLGTPTVSTSASNSSNK